MSSSTAQYLLPKASIALIGSAGVPGRYGGFETLAEEITTRLGPSCTLRVYCSTKNYPKGQRPKRWNGARLHYLPLDANGPQSIPYDILSMLHALFFCKVLCVLGVGGALFFPLVKLIPGKRLVVHLDGLEWQRAKWNRPTRAFLKFCEQIAVRFADRMVADNAALQRYLEERYGVESTLIAYGGDQAVAVRPAPEHVDRYRFLGSPYAFKVCRIVPENNVELILQAFAAVPERTLVFVGDWDSNAFALDLRRRYGNRSNIHLLNPIYDPEELGVLRSNAFLYIHGHSAGGTNPSLVEAMSLGLPIVAFGVSFNRETTENKALFFETVEDLIAVLRDVPVRTITEMGPQLKAIAERRYRWDLVAQAYAQLWRFASGESETDVPVQNPDQQGTQQRNEAQGQDADQAAPAFKPAGGLRKAG